MTIGKKLYFFYKQTIDMEKTAYSIMNLFEVNGFQIVTDVNEADIIFVIGGDNAFLQAARKTGYFANKLYVGINLDEYGFYTDFTIQQAEEMVQQLKNNELEIREYPLLEATIDNEIPFYCLNECTIRSNVIKTFVLEIFIDDFHFETFRGDGVIVATPSGSTAYNKSVRGAVVDPSLKSLQVSEISSLNSNRYRTLGTSFLLDPERIVTIKVVQDGNDHPIIGFDNEAMGIKHAKKIKLTLSDRNIKVLKMKQQSFWHQVHRHFIQ